MTCRRVSRTNWRGRSPVPDNSYFDEEEFDSKFDGRTLARIFGLVRPHWKWVAGFLLAVATVSVLESYFTLLTKRIIDEAIVPRDTEALKGLLLIYIGIALVFAFAVFS